MSQPLACIDANIFLAVLIPEAARAPKDEIAGAARLLKAVDDGLYLATGLVERVDLLISTDPHLLSVRDLKTIPPSQYR